MTQVYTVEIDGQQVDIEGDRPPNEAEARQALSAHTQATAPPAVPPQAAPAPPTDGFGANSRAGRFARAIPGGVGHGLLSMIDPRTYIGAAKGAYTAVTRPAEVPGMIGRAAHGLYDQATESPESAGHLTGELATGAIPFTGLLSKAKLAERAASALGYSRTGRVSNIARAISAAPEDIPAISRLEHGIDLPITGHKGLERALKGRVETTGRAVEDAEAMLPVTDIPINDITSRMTSPEIPLSRMTPDGPVTVNATSDPQLANAVRGRRQALKATAGWEESLPSDVVVQLKRQAQGATARGKGYSKTLPGDEAGASTEASMREADALKQVLEELPGAEAAALTKANLAAHTAQTLYQPVGRESARRLARPMVSAITETLFGRALVPSLIGGGAGLAVSPTAALTGLAVGRFLQSPVWNTFQAATKRRLLTVLESGDLSAFQNEAAKVAVAEGITERERRHKAQRALRGQAEGVVTP